MPRPTGRSCFPDDGAPFSTLLGLMIFLETDRLLFRSHELQDEDEFVKMHTDPEVRRYVGGRPWPVEEAIHRFRNGYLGRPDNTYGLWATILKEEEKYIGACGLSSPPDKPVPSLGYYIARPYWGRRLASEASAKFLEVGFTSLRLPRVLADVQKGHAVSERILQKFGFKLVSEEEIPGRGRIISLYELTKEEWERNLHDPAPNPI
ncbi:MAG: GNAT family N-acetyltransferase [Candidatus Acidiferrum sp.]